MNIIMLVNARTAIALMALSFLYTCGEGVVDPGRGAHSIRVRRSVDDSAVQSEDLEVGSLVFSELDQLFDQDFEPDGYTEYRLTSISSYLNDVPLATASVQQFAVDKYTGDVRLASALDYEKADRHELSVSAVDYVASTGFALSSLTLDLAVRDVNDNIPLCDNHAVVAATPEDSAPGTSVAQLVCSDQEDATDLTYSVVYQTNGNHFSAHSNATLTLVSELDYENFTQHVVHVEVSDRGASALTTTVTVYVSVEPANDLAPTFDSFFTSISVTEDTAVGSTVYTITANDADADVGSIVTYGMTPEGAFSIDPISGDIFIKRRLTDYDVGGLFTTVLGSDCVIEDCAPSRYGDTLFMITISGAFDSPPEFVPESYEIEISEHIDIGSTVTTVTASSSRGLVYSLLGVGHSGEFQIDPSSGVITTCQALDSDSVSVYHLYVETEITDSPHLYAVAPVTVTVTDINDFYPEFTYSEYYIELLEGSYTSHELYQFEVYDQDSYRSDVTEFTLGAGGDSRFTLHADTGLLEINGVFDREGEGEYVTVVVEAVDEGVPPLTSTATLSVLIKDINDNPPEFEQGVYDVTISSESEAGSVVQTLPVTDSDLGQNGEFMLFITSGNEKGYFYIPPGTSGELLVTSSGLDEGLYSLVVGAVDGGIPQLSGSVRIDVTVEDTRGNIYAPQFSAGSYTLQLAEGAYQDVSLYQFDSYDIEEGSDRGAGYSLPTPDSRFEVTPLGVLVLTGELDYESEPRVQVVITDTDIGDPSLTGTSTLTLLISDVNDNPPVFDASEYSFNTNDPYPSWGALVGAVSATDADTGRFGEGERAVYYSIVSGGEEGSLYIDAWSGEIHTTTAPGLEGAGWSCSLIVRASDVGGLNTTVAVEVVVPADESNKFEPIFTAENQNITMSEGEYSAEELVVLSAFDPDQLGADELSPEEGVDLSIGEGQDSRLTIDPESGLVTLTGHIDRESEEFIIVEVEATDRGAPARTATTKVRLMVADLNDNPPVFSETGYTLTVTHLPSTHTHIGSVAATDPDLGTGGNFTFGLLSGNELGVFDIDPYTGSISVASNAPQPGLHRLEVIARDQGQPSLNSTVTVEVSIGENVTERNPPLFTSSQYVISVEEGVYEGEQVLTMYGYDVDGDAFTFHTEDGDGRVEIGDVDGVVRVRGELDAETETECHVVIVITDVTSASSTATLTLLVLNINDNSPIFTDPLYTATFDTSVSRHDSVVQSQASDADDGDEGALVYGILSGNDEGYFYMEPLSGELRVATEFLNPGLYNIGILAQDMGAPSLNDTANVTLTVEGVNKYGPIFTSNNYTALLIEGVYTGEEAVIQVAAFDVDGGETGVSYELLESSDERFTINSTTGAIHTSGAVRSEEGSVVQLVVIATDQGEPRLSVTSLVTMVILDVNDNPPQFLEDVYEIELGTDDVTGAEVVRVEANDTDTGRNGEISYGLSGGNVEGLFKIDPSTGLITLTTGVVGEGLYNISVTARDHGLPPLDSTCSVLVYVTPSNNTYPPAFTQQSYNTVMSEGHVDGVGVLVLTAVDPDQGPDGVLMYSLEEGADPRLQVNTTTGLLTVSGQFDAETETSVVVTVLCADSGLPSLTGSALVTLYIADTNDNTPYFTQGAFTVPIASSDAVSGHVIGTFTARDNDSSTNDVIYSISAGNERGYFSVEPLTGRLSIGSDLIESGNYTVVVMVTDTGAPPLNATVDVFVCVSEGNRYQPVFSAQEYFIEILEGSYDLREVGSVFAYDPDPAVPGVAPGNVMSYWIDSADSRFTVNATSGRIYVTGSLSTEEGAEVTIGVSARDGGQPELTGSATVIFKIRDVNDNPPVFESDVYNVSVTTVTALEADILQLVATDDDLGAGGLLYYAILSGNEGGLFDIDSVSGNLTLTSVSPTDGQYSVYILASDRGIPSLNTTAVVNIQINISRQNTHAPQFPAETYHVTVPEGEYAGARVPAFRVTSFDADSLSVEYRLREDGDGRFTVDPVSGELLVTGRVDYEGGDSDGVVLVVEALDPGVPVLSGSCTVVVSVTDINDNSPIFTQSEYSATLRVEEGYTPGDDVMRVVAMDTDAGRNGEVVYSIDSGNELGHFYIDPLNGTMLLLTGDVDSTGVYTLGVSATDSGTPPLNTTTIARIQFLPDRIYDIAPPEGALIVFIDEAASVGDVLISVDDVTSSLPADPIYSIVSGDEGGLFSVDPDGVVVLSGQLDREVTESFVLTLSIADSSDPGGVSVNKEIVVILNDANDHSPVFDTPAVGVSFPENQISCQPILSVSASDADTGSNSDVTYTLIQHTDPPLLTIDPGTGDVTLRQALDYEQMPYIEFEVLARDGGDPGLEGSLAVNLTVVDGEDSNVTVISGENRGTLYVTTEIGYTLGEHSNVLTLTPERFGLEEGASVRYSATGDVSGFTVLNTGELIRTGDPLDPYQSYIIGVLAEQVWLNGTSDVTVGLVRVDTLDPDRDVVDVEVCAHSSSLNHTVAELIGNLSTIFPTGHVGLHAMTSQPSPECDSGMSATLAVYVIENPTSRDIGFIHQDKMYMEQDVVISRLVTSLPDNGTGVVLIAPHTSTLTSTVGRSRDNVYVIGTACVLVVCVAIGALFSVWVCKTRSVERISPIFVPTLKGTWSSVVAGKSAPPSGQSVLLTVMRATSDPSTPPTDSMKVEDLDGEEEPPIKPSPHHRHRKHCYACTHPPEWPRFLEQKIAAKMNFK